MSEYHRHISTEVIPVLARSLENHSEYWTLKDDTPLRAYIDSLVHRTLDRYFTPDMLITLIQDQAYRLNLKEPGNNDIIQAENSPLQAIFNRKTLWVPDLYKHCLPHINIVNNSVMLDKLRNIAVQNELYIEPSQNTVLYKDPSAQFWVPNDINQLVCHNRQITYSWSDLHHLFMIFFATPSSHVTQLEGAIYSINPSSVLAQKLKFKRFHKGQITMIVQNLSQYLGKTSTIMSICPKLTFAQCSPTDPIVYWLENEICALEDMSETTGRAYLI